MLFDNDIKECLQTLAKGDLILYPTDTVWGIGCDATNKNAVAKIYEIKKRAESKSMIILLAKEEDISNYCEEHSPIIFDYVKGINKPVTVIYRNAKNLANNIINEDGSIAIRIVKDEFCSKLIEAFGKPIVSTSANISGLPTPSLFIDIDIEIKNAMDYIVQYRQDDFTAAKPSSIIGVNPDGSINVIRK